MVTNSAAEATDGLLALRPSSRMDPAAVLPFLIALLGLSCFVSQTAHNVAFCLASGLLLYVVWKARGARQLYSLPGLDLPLALYTASFLVSAALGVNPSNSFQYVTELKRLVVAYVVANAVTRQRDMELLVAAIFTGALITTLVAYLQTRFGATITIHGRTLTYGPGQFVSPIGLASTSNDLAVLLAVALGLAAAPFLFHPLGARSRGVLGACVLIISYGVLRTLSRSGAVAAFLSMLATGLVLRPRLLIAPVIALIAVYPLLPAPLTARHSQIFDLRVYPNAFRLRMVEVSLELSRQHLPWGIGRRNYEPEHTKILRPKEEPSPHAHNNYLNVLVEQGIAGLVALVWFQIALLTYLVRRMRDKLARAGRPLVETATLSGLFMGHVAFAITGLFHYDWGDAMPASLMWICVGLTYAIGDGRIVPADGGGDDASARARPGPPA
jgi:O-antigen ligase